MTVTAEDVQKDTAAAHGSATGNSARDTRSIAELIKHAGEQVSILVTEEIKLARLELSSKGKRAGRGAGLLGAALFIVLYAVGALVAAAVLGVAVVFEPWLAALIVGGGLLLLAIIFALIGKRQLSSAAPPVPSETLESVRADMEALKGKS